MSHPLWVRGLKFIVGKTSDVTQSSHPLWVRGLKFTKANKDAIINSVAPFMGAWIEILAKGRPNTSD